jgi:predicted DsbA family dithiol-disulfide isomerase
VTSLGIAIRQLVLTVKVEVVHAAAGPARPGVAGAGSRARGARIPYALRMPKLRVDVWSDVACPWCYVGKRRLDAAIARMPSPGDVVVVYRSFELDPKAPRVERRRTTYVERLARKYRASREQAQAMVERIARVGAADGIEFRFDLQRRGNTFDAHRLLHLAGERGVQGALKERLLRAYFTEGEPIGDRKALARLAGEAGLDGAEVRRVFAGDAYAAAVRADEEEARRQLVHSVPFYGIAEVYGLSGAQPVDLMHGALLQAWQEAPGEAPPRGSACGRDGCT